jgi:ribosomal protein S8
LALDVPEEHVFLEKPVAAKLLEQNGSFYHDNLLGIVVSKDEQAPWFVVIRYEDEGYIKDYSVVEATDDKGQPLPYKVLVVELKFARDRRRVITNLKRVSKPGRRVYARKDRLPRVLGGLGTAIMSTSVGVITNRQAAERGVGGEVIAFVW